MRIDELEIPFDKNTSTGWWEDGDFVEVYHGTNIKNLESIEKNGLTKADPKTGMISVTLSPYTAFGYAAMSGGEATFRKANNKAITTPPEDRIVLKFKLPIEWLYANMDKNYGGNIGIAKKNIQNKNEYILWKDNNKESSDHNYYEFSEFRLNKPIPPSFYIGYSRKIK